MEVLTKTENLVSKYVAYGLTEKEIATKMFVSDHTVHTHTKNIRKKTGARNMADITRIYILSLPEPKKFFAGMFFLLLQFFMIFNDYHFDMRKPQSQKIAGRKGKGKKSKKDDYDFEEFEFES